MGKRKGGQDVQPIQPPKPSLTDLWDHLGGLGQAGVKIGAAVAMIYGAYIWGSDKIVWAEQFDQVVAGIDCQFADLKRTQLEGQAADTQFRINQLSGRKAMSSDDARDLAALNVRLSNIHNQLNRLPDCSRSAPQQQQQRRR